jgi:hypothetical protein
MPFAVASYGVGAVRRARGPDFGDLRPIPTRSGDSGGSNGDGTARPGLWMVRQGFDNRGMSDPDEFYRTFQSLLRGRAIAGVLTSGMACVEYGIQQNTKDTDWIVAPADIAGRDVVARMKKTDRPKDWPLVNALAIQAPRRDATMKRSHEPADDGPRRP